MKRRQRQVVYLGELPTHVPQQYVYTNGHLDRITAKDKINPFFCEVCFDSFWIESKILK